MEDSAYQAMYTGVYVFVFVIALSSTIYLFKTMSDYADLAYEYGQTVVSDNIIENISDSNQRLLTGSDVIAYYFNYTDKDKYEDEVTGEYTILYGDIGIPTNRILKYDELRRKIDINAKYIVTYQAVSNGKTTITIRQVH